MSLLKGAPKADSDSVISGWGLPGVAPRCRIHATRLLREWTAPLPEPGVAPKGLFKCPTQSPPASSLRALC